MGVSPLLMALVSVGLAMPALALPPLLPPLPTTPAVRADSVSGTAVVVAAEASDNVGVAGVQFLLNGVALGPEDVAAPYSVVWDTTAVADGTHTLTARARDLAGNESVSDGVSVVVANGPAGDTTPPTVTATSPANGALVRAMVSVAAAADDDVGVEGVQFLLDGAPLGAEDREAPWEVSWDTTGAADGHHTLHARARDAAGNIATSAGVGVEVDNTVEDTSPPEVVTTSPEDGATVSGEVALAADATDDVEVARVQFLIDGENFGEGQTSAPYSIVWDTTRVGDGPHTIIAMAWDREGNTSTSAPISVLVNNESPDDPEPPISHDAHVELTFEHFSDRSEVVIRAGIDVAAVNQLALLIDGQEMFTTGGASLEYTWDTRPLVGRHEVHVVGYDELMQVVASSSAYQVDVEPKQGKGKGRGRSQPSSSTQAGILFGMEPAPDSGAVGIEASSGMDGIRSIELYIDGALVASARRGRTLEYQWDPGPHAGPHEVVVAALDRSGVVAVASVVSP